MIRNRWRRVFRCGPDLLHGSPARAGLVPLAFILFYVVTQGSRPSTWISSDGLPAPVGRARRRHGECHRWLADVIGLGAIVRDSDRCLSGVYAGGIPRHPAARRPPGSPPTRSTVCHRSSSACSRTGLRCFRSRALLGARGRPRPRHHDDPADHAARPRNCCCSFRSACGKVRWRWARLAHVRSSRWSLPAPCPAS